MPRTVKLIGGRGSCPRRYSLPNSSFWPLSSVPTLYVSLPASTEASQPALGGSTSMSFAPFVGSNLILSVGDFCSRLIVTAPPSWASVGAVDSSHCTPGPEPAGSDPPPGAWAFSRCFHNLRIITAMDRCSLERESCERATSRLFVLAAAQHADFEKVVALARSKSGGHDLVVAVLGRCEANAGVESLAAVVVLGQLFPGLIQNA